MTEPLSTPSSPPPPARPLRVAAAQAPAVPGDLPGNARTAAALVAGAAAEGAGLVVLPELFLPAYHPPTLAADPAACDVVADAAETVVDPRLDPLREAAREHHVVVVVSGSVRRAGSPARDRTLSALVVGRDGGIRVGYDKQNLHGPDERSLFRPGERGASIEVDGWRWGLGICYDGCFPEHARAAALAGCHGMLYPVAYSVGSRHRRDLYYRARALDNTMYVVMAGAVDGPAPWTFGGGSAVYDPEGRTLGQAPETGRAVVVAEARPDELARARWEHPMLAEARLRAGV